MFMTNWSVIELVNIWRDGGRHLLIGFISEVSEENGDLIVIVDVIEPSFIEWIIERAVNVLIEF